MEESLSSLMDEIRGRVELLESSLPKCVDAMAVSPESGVKTLISGFEWLQPTDFLEYVGGEVS